MEKQYHSYIAMSVKFSQFFHSPRGKEGDLGVNSGRLDSRQGAKHAKFGIIR